MNRPEATARLPNLERRLAAVARVLEHVVEDEHAARRDVRRPGLVVGQHNVEGVTAVDEHQPERRGPVRGDRRRVADDGDHGVLEPGVLDRAAEERQRVHAARLGIDDLGVVVLPPGLVLLRAPVVVDAEKHRAAGARRRAQVHGRLPAVAADLEERPHGSPVAARGVEREPLVVGHEALGGARSLEEAGVHPQMTGSSRWRPNTSARAPTISPTVACVDTASTSPGMRLTSGSAASARMRERGVDRGVVAIASHAGEALQLGLLHLGPDAQDLELLVAALRGDVHAHDEVTAVVELALELVGGLGDLALEPSRLDGAEHAFEERAVAEPVEVVEHGLGLALHLVGELLDEPRAAERVGHVRDAGLVGDHLLGPQRQAGGVVGREGEHLVHRVRVEALRAAEDAGERLYGRADDVDLRLLRR